MSPRGRNDNRARREQSRKRSPRRREDAKRTVINTISGKFKGGGPSRSARKRHLRAIKSVNIIG